MKRKKIITIVTIVILLILLMPRKYGYTDGGSVEYRAILYTVRFENSIHPDYSIEEAKNVGTIITICGIEVYNDVELVYDNKNENTATSQLWEYL